MRRPLTCALLVAAATVLSVSSALAFEWTFTNNSRYTIREIYISPCSTTKWGNDRLGDRSVLEPGESASLNRVPRGCYDVLLVDEDRDKCEVRGINVNADWQTNITNNNLISCQGTGR
jgi:hypothetical protein